MRVKIDTWDRMVEKFGTYKSCIDSTPLFIPYQEDQLPEDRIITIDPEFDYIKNEYVYTINNNYWSVDKAVCREVL